MSIFNRFQRRRAQREIEDLLNTCIFQIIKYIHGTTINLITKVAQAICLLVTILYDNKYDIVNHHIIFGLTNNGDHLEFYLPRDIVQIVKYIGPIIDDIIQHIILIRFHLIIPVMPNH